MALAQTVIKNGVRYTQLQRIGNVATWKVTDPRMFGSRVYQTTKIVGEQFPMPLPSKYTDSTHREHRRHRATDKMKFWAGRPTLRSAVIRPNSGAIIKNRR